MKHLKKYIIASLSVLLLVGCSDKYSEELGLKPTLTPRYISVSPTSLSFSANSSISQAVSIETTETPWRIDNGIDWASISSTSGSTSSNINVSVAENTNGSEARTGVFYVKADVSDWAFETGVSVSQAAATPYINLSQTSVTFDGKANSATISVTANCTYGIQSSAEWLTAAIDGNTITLTATANETSQYRNASIIVTCTTNSSVYTTVTITQAPAAINASTDALQFENTAGEVTINVASEASWTASTSYSWISVSPQSGTAGTSSLTISVSPNTSVEERTGYVVLSVGSEQRIQIPVKQRGIYIETDKLQCEFGASAETQTLQVISNTSWQISNLPSWITVDKTSGSGNAEIKVTAEENPNTTERSGEFLVSQSGLSAQAVVKVSQKGKTFDVATTTLNFNDKQETQSVTVTTDGTWRAYTSADWITISPESATGSATLNITVAENENEGERSGSVIIMMGDASATIAVVQKGKYFTIANSILDFTSKGGSLGISLTTNTSWTARVDNDASWLSVSPSSGNTDAEVTITSVDNPSVNNRSVNVYFDALGRNVNLLVTQKARYLTIDTNELLFYSKGGTSTPVTISTDGAYSISTTDSWMTISQTGNTFTVTATENSTTDARIGHITIALTDLKEGTYSVTLTVTQLNYGGTFLRKDYGEDENYDNTGSSAGTIVITGYGSDTNYDTNSQSGTKLSITSYKSDTSWDSTVSSSAKVTITGYGSDQSLDSKTTSSGSVSKNGYSSDNNWN